MACEIPDSETTVNAGPQVDFDPPIGVDAWACVAADAREFLVPRHRATRWLFFANRCKFHTWDYEEIMHRSCCPDDAAKPAPIPSTTNYRTTFGGDHERHAIEQAFVLTQVLLPSYRECREPNVTVDPSSTEDLSLRRIRRSSEPATAVDDEALACDETCRLGREEAHRVGDVLGRPDAARRHRGDVGAPDLVPHIRVALDGDEARSDRVHGDSQVGELSGPAARETDLGALRCGVGGRSRRRPVGDLGVDLHDAPEPSLAHCGERSPPEQDRALDEELELRDVVRPRHIVQRSFRLRAGRVQHQHLDRAEPLGDRRHECDHLPLVGDVSREGLRDPSPLANGTDDCERLLPAVPVVDGYGQPIPGEAAGDRAAKPALTPGHKGNARLMKACRQGGSSTLTELIGNRFWPSGALARSLKPKACVSMGAE